MSFFESFLSYRSDKANYKIQKKLQAYKNKMTNLANAINQNALTTNTSLQIQQSARQAVHMRKDELSAVGSTAVAAAAAGVRGNSVTQTLMTVQQGAAGLEKQRQDDLSQYFTQTDQQRLSSRFSALQQQDLSYIPKPKLGMYLLKGAMNAAKSMVGAGSSDPFAGMNQNINYSAPNVRTDSFSSGVSTSHFSRSNETVYWR